jgi:hypothetical protein
MGVRFRWPVSWRPFGLLAVVAAWLVAVLFQTLLWERYERSPGLRGAVPAILPQTGPVQAVTGRSTLLLFAHPHCPCTRATLEQLNSLIARSPRRTPLRVLFERPEGCPEGWERTAIWRQVGEIPGAELSVDPEGKEARRFGVTTSGHVLLYDSAGRRLYSGGITSARGQAGENAASAALGRALRDGRAAGREFPVFGCALATPAGPRQGGS